MLIADAKEKGMRCDFLFKFLALHWTCSLINFFVA